MIQIDIIKYLNDRGIVYKKKGKNIGGDWIGIETCPYSNCQAGGYHFAINSKTLAVNCWLCGGHSIKNTLFQWEKNYNKVNQVFDKYNLDIDKVIFKEEKKIYHSQNYKLPIDFTDKFTEPYKLYLKNRNFDFLELRKKYNILCGGDTGRGRYRIIFPVYENGKIVNWIGRTILQDKSIMPYMFEKDENNPLVLRKELLYGLDDSNGDTIILVEGIFDALRLGRGAIALLSINFTKTQLVKLKNKKIKNYYLMLDNDNAGINASKKLESYLTFAQNINYIEYDSKDPDSLSDSDIKKIRRMVF